MSDMSYLHLVGIEQQLVRTRGQGTFPRLFGEPAAPPLHPRTVRPRTRTIHIPLQLNWHLPRLGLHRA